jgi:hypothetical protein
MGLMTYVSCCKSIFSLERAATLEEESAVVGADIDRDEALFIEDETLVVAGDGVEDLLMDDDVDHVAFLIDKDDVDFDFELDEGVDRTSAADLFGTFDLARVGTKIK